MNAQVDRREHLLRDVVRSGGTDNWDHLRSHGHHIATIRSAISDGYLAHLASRVYQITDAGRECAARSPNCDKRKD